MTDSHFSFAGCNNRTQEPVNIQLPLWASATNIQKPNKTHMRPSNMLNTEDDGPFVR